VESRLLADVDSAPRRIKGSRAQRRGCDRGCPEPNPDETRADLRTVHRLRVPSAILDALHAHAREGAPQEVCGLLAGRTAASGEREIVRAFRVPNAHPRPVGEYRLDPQEQLRLTLHVEDELGLEVVGFYHSHPAGPARLSATDAARASWPGASYLLIHLKPHEGHLSARWDADANRFVPEPVQAD